MIELVLSLLLTCVLFYVVITIGSFVFHALLMLVMGVVGGIISLFSWIFSGGRR